MVEQSNNLATNDSYPKDKYYSLFKVIGFASKDNFSISCNKVNGLTAWIAGPYVILYDIKKDKQMSFIKNKNNKVISCVCFSEKGDLIATGEGNCRNGEVIIYDISFCESSSVEKHCIKMSFKYHKYGIEKIKFFCNDKFLISIGDREDKLINIFSINSTAETGMKNDNNIYSMKFNHLILCFDICDSFFIIGGDKYVKIFSYEDLEKNDRDKKNLLTKSNAELSKLKDKIFTSCVIFNSQPDKRILFLTSDGYLAEMKSSSKQISRWMNLKAEKGLSLCLYDQLVACGCGDGIIRIFNLETLTHVMTLHRPPPLGKANIDSELKKINISVTHDEKFADVISLCYCSFHEKLITIYSDKTFFVWDLKKSDKIFVFRYGTFHCGSITNMDVAVSDNVLKLATSSDDKTVRVWNFKIDDFIPTSPLPAESIPSKKLSHIAYSKYIRRIFYFGKVFSHFKVKIEDLLQGGLPADNINDINEDIIVTSVKISPDEKHLACGDNIGNLYIFNITNTFEQVNVVSAHNGTISAIDFIKTNDGKGKYLMATGSIDTLINIIDVTIGFEKDFENYERSVLYDHQTPITSLVFCIDKFQNIKLISAASDSSINFYIVKSATSIQLVQKFHEEGMSTYCLAYCPASTKIIAGHNGRVTIWKTSSCIVHNIMEMNKGDKLLDNFRIAVDSSGRTLAISNNDKFIRIRSSHDGKLLTKIPIAESVSSLFFAINDNFLIATSVEGYIYFFKIEIDLINSLFKELNIMTSTEEKNILTCKLKLLQKFMENDTNLSKNEQVQFLLEKMKNSEDLKIEDLKMLDRYSHFIRTNTDDVNKATSNADDNPNNIKFADKILLEGGGLKSGNSEVISIKEEKPNNEDEDENENNINNTKENQQISGNANTNMYLTKSKIFEKGLKEIPADTLKKSILSQSRVSLTESYMKKKGEVHFPKKDFLEGLFTKATVNLTKDTEATGVITCTQAISTGSNNNSAKAISNNFLSSIPQNEKNNIINPKHDTTSTKEVREIKTIISSANKAVDDIENKLNNILGSSPSEGTKDNEYNERISSILGKESSNPPPKNIFMKNLHQETITSSKNEISSTENIIITTNNKFSNIVLIDEQKKKDQMDDIYEDLNSEEFGDNNTMQKGEITQTDNLEVSDTLVQKARGFDGKVNTTTTLTGILNTGTSNQSNNDTLTIDDSSTKAIEAYVNSNRMQMGIKGTPYVGCPLKLLIPENIDSFSISYPNSQVNQIDNIMKNLNVLEKVLDGNDISNDNALKEILVYKGYIYNLIY